MNARTKIVATLGPASDPPHVLDAMLLAGVDVVRLNLSHGHSTEHIARLHAVREAADTDGLRRRRARRPARAEGPRRAFPGWRRGAGRRIDGHAGHRRRRPAPAAVIGVDYETLLADLHAGDRIVIGDGAITLAGRADLRRAVPSVRCAAVVTPRAARACTFRRSGCGSRRRHREDLVLAAAMAARASTSSPCRSFATPTTSPRCATPSPR